MDASFFDTEGQRRELPSQNSSAVDLGAQGAGSFSWLSPSRSVSVSPLPESALVGAGTPNPRGNLLQGVQFEGTPVVVVDDGEEETRGDSGEEADVEADDSHTAPLLRSNGEDQEPALGPKGSSVRRKRSWSKKRGEAAVDPRVAHTARGARKKRLAIRLLSHAFFCFFFQMPPCSPLLLLDVSPGEPQNGTNSCFLTSPCAGVITARCFGCSFSFS